MNYTSFFDSQEIKDMCNDYIALMNEEIAAYQSLSDSIDSFLENEESQSIAIDGIKEHMEDYKLVFSALISANEEDIIDSHTFISIVRNEHIEGYQVIEGKKFAKSKMDEYGDKEYSAYLNLIRSTSQEQVDYYTGEMEKWRGMKNEAQNNYNYYREKEETYDEIYNSSKQLFLDSQELRREARNFLKVLNTSFENGAYNNVNNPEYRDNLLDKIYQSWDNNGEYDVAKIYADLGRVEDMSDEEFNRLIAALRAMGIDVPLVYTREYFKEAVYHAILDKYNSFIDNPDTGNTAPFDSLSQEERDLFVYLYEEKYPDDARNMNVLTNQLGSDENYYDGWEVDARNIKFLIYTSEEPAKSTYIKNAGSGNITVNTNADAFSNSGTTFNININEYKDSNGNHTIGFYSCFIHESCHAIYHNTNLEGTYAQRMTDIMKEDLTNRIEDQVDIWLSNNDDFKSLSEEDRRKIKDFYVDCILNQIDIEQYGIKKTRTERINGSIITVTYYVLDFDYILNSYGLEIDNFDAEDAEKCFVTVVGEINKTLDGPIADQYGGLSGNTVGHGHDPVNGDRVYWVETDPTNGRVVIVGNDSYNVDNYPNGNYIDEDIILNDSNVDYQEGKIANEMFAETMDSYITRRYDEVENRELYSDETMDCFNDMVDSAYNRCI